MIFQGQPDYSMETVAGEPEPARSRSVAGAGAAASTKVPAGARNRRVGELESPPIRLAVVDPTGRVMAAFGSLLTSSNRFLHLGVCPSVQHVLRLHDAHPPEMMLVDIASMGSYGLRQDLTIACRLFSDTHVVAVPVAGDVNGLKAALVTGVVGHLPVEFEAQQAWKRLGDIRSRPTRRDPKVMQACIRDMCHDGFVGPSRRSALSRGELTVLDAMAESGSYEAVYARLQISPNTVRSYASTACRKLGAASLPEALLNGGSLLWGPDGGDGKAA